MTELQQIAIAARDAQRTLALCTDAEKSAAITAIADALISRRGEILAANEEDVARAAEGGTSEAMLDRLRLDEKRIAGIAEGARQVAALPDPVGEVIESFERPNGLRISKVRVPLGVIGMIYEARPNVTVDSAVLALRSGNAILLRGSSSAERSNRAICAVMRDALASGGVPADAVQGVFGGGHERVNELMKMRGYVDVLIPRGGDRLISSVVENSVVPVIETGVGNCHVYVDRSADVEMAATVAVNAKAQRPAVCNAAETILFHRDFPGIVRVCEALATAGVTLHVTPEIASILASGAIPAEKIVPADEADFETEYKSLDIAVAAVGSTKEAIDHIRRYSTGHTECIVTEDGAEAEKFIAAIDSAVVDHNASTRFTDGFEFGFGAEIGISTQKLHARGPLGLRELCSFKYVVRGNGQVRG